MMALSNAAAKDLDVELGELIKIRASQINHCAFCLDMHTRDARKHGVSEQKLDVLAAWEEAGQLFTEQRAGRAGPDRGDHRTRRRPCARRGVPACGAGVLRTRARSGDRDGGDHQCVEPHQRRPYSRLPDKGRVANTVEGCRPAPVQRSSSTATWSTSCTGREPTRGCWRPDCVWQRVAGSADTALDGARTGRRQVAHALAVRGNGCAATRIRAMGRGGAVTGPAAPRGPARADAAARLATADAPRPGHAAGRPE